MAFGRGVETKSTDQLLAMRAAGLVVGETLAMLGERLTPGMTTGELDALATEHIRSRGMRPNFSEVPGYRHTLCVSVNEEIVHGIPGERVLREGDLVSIDAGCYLPDDPSAERSGGWHGDAARTFVVGGDAAARPEDLDLVAVTADSMWAGAAAMADGARLNDIGAAIEDLIEERADERDRTFGIIEEYVGHGIGRAMHMDPQVPNYRVRGKGPRLTPGVTLAIEPMVTLGSAANHVLGDDWTVVASDGSRAAHWENTVALTEHGVWVLTEVDGGRARLEALGVPFGGLDG